MPAWDSAFSVDEERAAAAAEKGRQCLQALLAQWTQVQRSARKCYLLLDWSPSDPVPPVIILHRQVVKLTPLMWTLPVLEPDPERQLEIQAAFTALRIEAKTIGAFEKLYSETSSGTNYRRRVASAAAEAVDCGLFDHPWVREVVASPWYSRALQEPTARAKPTAINSKKLGGKHRQDSISARPSNRHRPCPPIPVASQGRTSLALPPPDLYEGFALVGYITSDGFFAGEAPANSTRKDTNGINQPKYERSATLQRIKTSRLFCCSPPSLSLASSADLANLSSSREWLTAEPKVAITPPPFIDMTPLPAVITMRPVDAVDNVSISCSSRNRSSSSSTISSRTKNTVDVTPVKLSAAPELRITTPSNLIQKSASANDLAANRRSSLLSVTSGQSLSRNRFYHRPDALSKFALRLSLRDLADSGEFDDLTGDEEQCNGKVPPELLASLARHLKARRKISRIIQQEKEARKELQPDDGRRKSTSFLNMFKRPSIVTRLDEPQDASQESRRFTELFWKATPRGSVPTPASTQASETDVLKTPSTPPITLPEGALPRVSPSAVGTGRLKSSLERLMFLAGLKRAKVNTGLLPSAQRIA